MDMGDYWVPVAYLCVLLFLYVLITNLVCMMEGPGRGMNG